MIVLRFKLELKGIILAKVYFVALLQNIDIAVRVDLRFENK